MKTIDIGPEGLEQVLARMKGITMRLALAVLGVVLIATNALAVASPMTATGPQLNWNTFVGGALSYGYYSSIAVDAGGNIYVTGVSSSTWGAPVRPFESNRDVYVAKFAADGALLWNTFLGGDGQDTARDIAIDTAGNVLMSGDSTAPWGTPILPWPGPWGSFDGFVAKLDTNGALLWNTFLVMIHPDSGVNVAVDPSGNVYATGDTISTWGSPISPWVGGHDVFVAKFDTDGALIWNTFFGHAGEDVGLGIAVDAGGSISVVGVSDGTWGDPIRPWVGSLDGFVARLDTNGAPLWNTFFGGAGNDIARDIAVDTSGSAYVAGWSAGDWGEPIRPWMGGPDDGFIVKIDTSGALLWNTFLGGTGDDGSAGIAIDAGGKAYVTGWSAGPWDSLTMPWDGPDNATVAMVDANGTLLWHTYFGGAGTDVGRSIAIDEDGNGYVSGDSTSTWGDPAAPWVSPASGSAANVFVAKFGNITNSPPAGLVEAKNDFDGDGRSDIGCYYPPGGSWYEFRSTDGFWQTTFGYAGTIPVTGDFDGDGKSDVGVYDPDTGSWHLLKSTEGSLSTTFGFAGTIPVVGDFDGDGRDDIGCYYAPGGNWYVYRSRDGYWAAQFGYAGTIPVVGDFDGDGRDDIGCYYPPGGMWYAYKSTEGFMQTQFGYAGTIPVVGDFDADGRSDIGCYHPPGGNWYVSKSRDGFWETVFGYVGTEPVVGDYDGDGRSDLGVYDPAGGNWYVFKSTEGFWEAQFGYEGTIPLGGTLR